MFSYVIVLLTCSTLIFNSGPEYGRRCFARTLLCLLLMGPGNVGSIFQSLNLTTSNIHELDIAQQQIHYYVGICNIH